MVMHVALVEPAFPHYQREFARALKQVGAYVTGIGERPLQALGSVAQYLDAYEQVPSVCHVPSMVAAVERIQQRGPWLDKIEATIEAHIEPAASVRQARGVPGLTPEQAVLCRDKPKMKAFLRSRGIPCAATAGVSSVAELKEFARQVGFPLIVKPRAGAGASGTYRIDDDAELIRVAQECGLADGAPVAAEEFVSGHEGFYDTLTIDGAVRLDFISHYYPGVLQAMRTRWISPQIVSTNRVSAESYDELKVLGAKVIAELGLGTTATHMEWFFGPKGLKFSEIGARPPGVGQWDVYCAGNEFDLYRQWAMAVVHGRLDEQPSRRFASGLIALRPDRDGRIVGYEGIDELQRDFGPAIVDAHFPPAGSPTQPVEAGYMANAWVRVRHPDYDELRRILDAIGQRLQVRAA
jgi:carbamoylphosphate synthase large subunit